MKYELTDKDFEFFRAECEKWIDRLSMRNWGITYARGGKETYFSTASINDQAKTALIRFPKNWRITYELKDKQLEIKETALHEILEVLLAPLQNPDLARDGELYDGETHSIIHRLTNVLKEKK